MRIDFNDLLYSLSYALDCVEFEVFGTKEQHARRVAYQSVLMGDKLGLSKAGLEDLAACALLHDNALTEYLATELEHGHDVLKEPKYLDLAPHCRSGEDNLAYLPLARIQNDVILCHHENVDGSGPFHRRGDEIPLFSQIIHTADIIDTNWGKAEPTAKGIDSVREFLERTSGVMFREDCACLLSEQVSLDAWEEMTSGGIDQMLSDVVPGEVRDYSNSQIRGIATLFARIVDYKSSFTMRHSIGIANKAETMARFYGYDDDQATIIYLTGALHDIGKMAISNDVLEKPDRLTGDEFVYMKNHAWFTYKILSGVSGFERIVDWAALHHEKLDGSGYPFGKTADELDFNDRLLGCIDIYQALTEPRPYKPALPHDEAVRIERAMAADGKIDGAIVEDIDAVFKDGTLNEVFAQRDVFA